MNRMRSTVLAGVLAIGGIWGMVATPARAQQPAPPSTTRPGYSYAYGNDSYSAMPRRGPASLSTVVRPGTGYYAARSHGNSTERYRDWTTGRSNSSLLSKPWLRPLP
jgi:hypothetical protein